MAKFKAYKGGAPELFAVQGPGGWRVITWHWMLGQTPFGPRLFRGGFPPHGLRWEGIPTHGEAQATVTKLQEWINREYEKK